MACHLVGAKPLFEPKLEYFYLNKLQWNFNLHLNIFIQQHAIYQWDLKGTNVLIKMQDFHVKNAFAIANAIYEMAAIFTVPLC